MSVLPFIDQLPGAKGSAPAGCTASGSLGDLQTRHHRLLRVEETVRKRKIN